MVKHGVTSRCFAFVPVQLLIAALLAYTYEYVQYVYAAIAFPRENAQKSVLSVGQIS